MVAPLTNTPDRSNAIVEKDGVATEDFFIWLALVTELLEKGYSGTITTAALTGPGTQGSMTFEHGILVSQTPAT